MRKFSRKLYWLFGTCLLLMVFNFTPAQAASSPTAQEQKPVASGQSPSAIAGTVLTFELPMAGEVVSGKVELAAKLSGQESLKGVTVQYSVFLAGSEEIIGTAAPAAGSGTFFYIWDTSQMINGLYNLKAEALSNSKKMAVSLITVEVKNDPGVVPETVITPVSLTVSSPKDGRVASGNLFLFAKGNVEFTGMKFILYDSTESVVFRGNGKLSSEAGGLTWMYGLETKRFANGEYFIGVETILGEKIFRSPKVRFVIKNNLEKVFSQVTVWEPEAKAVLAGEVKLTAVTDAAADSAQFKIDGALAVTGDDGNRLRLKARPDALGTKWQADLKTDQLQDGPYVLSAVAFKGSLVIESATILVSVKNDKVEAVEDLASKTAFELAEKEGEKVAAFEAESLSDEAESLSESSAPVAQARPRRQFPIAGLIGLVALGLFSAVLVIMFKINK